MSTFDTVVVGLGAMGSATVMHLARRGRRVLGVDRYEPPHELGSTHGRSRLIRCAYYEGADYVPLALRAWDQWLALGAQRGEELLTPTGALSMGPPGAEVVEGARRSAERWDLDHEILDAAQVARRWPVFRPAPGHLAVFETQAGFVRPEAAVAAMLSTAVAEGATLRTGTEVTGWEATPSGAAVQVRCRAATSWMRAPSCSPRGRGPVTSSPVRASPPRWSVRCSAGSPRRRRRPGRIPPSCTRPATGH